MSTGGLATRQPVSFQTPGQRPFVAIRGKPRHARRPVLQAARSAAEDRSPQQAEHSRRDALLLGAAAGVVLPGLMRSGDAAAAAPCINQPTAQQLCRASAFDASGRVGIAGNPVAEVAEGSVAARSNDRIQLGKSGLEVSPIGVGAWSWGDRSGYWGNDLSSDAKRAENLEAYKALVDNGVSLIDTAEVYGFGFSEEFIGGFMRQTGTSPAIATKFAPLPWRFSSSSVVDACKASLGRLGVDQLGLYQIHWPAFGTNWFRNDAFVKGLADCQNQGLTKAVGVSNFSEDRVRTASSILQDNGVPLASNQVQYSLLYRVPERNGVADAVKNAGATLIAYSPLCQGLLTGKYTKDNLPGGARALVINEERVAAVQPLLALMRDIGGAHGGKTPGQVAINWTICKGALPIPGAKNARQAKEAAGGFGWRMSDDEVAALDAASAKVPETTGAPFEKW